MGEGIFEDIKGGGEYEGSALSWKRKSGKKITSLQFRGRPGVLLEAHQGEGT